MSNLYLSVGAEVGVQGLDRGPRGHGASKWYCLEQVEPDRGGVCWLADGFAGAGSEILTCTLQLFTRDFAVARSNEVGKDHDWGGLAAGDPPLHMVEGGGAWLLAMRQLYQTDVYLNTLVLPQSSRQNVCIDYDVLTRLLLLSS